MTTYFNDEQKARRKEYMREYRNTHKDKMNEASKKSAKKYREKHAASNRNSFLKRTFGISLEEYNQMFEEQNGCCAICGRHQSELKQALNVDHDHKTGEIRGLLCYSCNTGIGLFKDKKYLLFNAIEYLGNGE